MSTYFLRLVSIPIFISLIILYLCCFIPTSDIPDITFDSVIGLDKLVHFFMFFGLSTGTALNYMYVAKGDVKISRIWLFAFFIPALYGGFIEIIQHYFFAERAGDWDDFFADCLGSFVALPFSFKVRDYYIKK